MGEALNAFVEEAKGLSADFDPATVFSIGGWQVTQYVIWLVIANAGGDCADSGVEDRPVP